MVHLDSESDHTSPGKSRRNFLPVGMDKSHSSQDLTLPQSNLNEVNICQLIHIKYRARTKCKKE